MYPCKTNNVAFVCKVTVKKIFRQNNTIFKTYKYIYNLTSLNMYNGISQVNCINQKEESICIQRVKYTSQ